MSNTIGIRVTKAEKKRLAEIAIIKGVSLSAFLRSAAATEASRVLGAPHIVASSGCTK